MDEQQGFVAETIVDQDPLKLVPNLTICSDLDPVSEVVGKQQVVIAEEFNEFLTLQENPVTTQPNEEGIESSSIMKPNVATEIIGEIVFSISEVDKKDAAARFAFDLLSLSYSEFAKLFCTTTVSEDLLAPEKTVACTVIVAAPLPKHLFI
ncbi:hypothetical protein A2U01_0045090, partial [Trifolium medium]|nr:hypothetical protein [Trifolium medium]